MLRKSAQKKTIGKRIIVLKQEWNNYNRKIINDSLPEFTEKSRVLFDLIYRTFTFFDNEQVRNYIDLHMMGIFDPSNPIKFPFGMRSIQSKFKAIIDFIEKRTENNLPLRRHLLSNVFNSINSKKAINKKDMDGISGIILLLFYTSVPERRAAGPNIYTGLEYIQQNARLIIEHIHFYQNEGEEVLKEVIKEKQDALFVQKNTNHSNYPLLSSFEILSELQIARYFLQQSNLEKKVLNQFPPNIKIKIKNILKPKKNPVAAAAPQIPANIPPTVRPNLNSSTLKNLIKYTHSHEKYLLTNPHYRPSLTVRTQATEYPPPLQEYLSLLMEQEIMKDGHTKRNNELSDILSQSPNDLSPNLKQKFENTRRQSKQDLDRYMKAINRHKTMFMNKHGRKTLSAFTNFVRNFPSNPSLRFNKNTPTNKSKQKLINYINTGEYKVTNNKQNRLGNTRFKETGSVGKPRQNWKQAIQHVRRK